MGGLHDQIKLEKFGPSMIFLTKSFVFSLGTSVLFVIATALK